LVALVTTFDPLWYVGAHSVRHIEGYRVSLYTADLAERLAVIPDVRYPINDVAFHPTRPLVALALGAHDGASCFEGQLLVWDWQHNELVDVLAGKRAAWRVRFTDSGDLAVVLRPPLEPPVLETARELYAGALRDLRPYRALGLDDDARDPRLADFAPSATSDGDAPRSDLRWRRAFADPAFEYRSHVWDVAWGRAGQILAVHQGCQLEAWDRDGRRTLDIRGPGHGVQILQAGDATYVHVYLLELATPRAATRARSKLFRLDGDRLSEFRTFDSILAFSIDRGGRLLGRDASWRSDHPRRDHVVRADGRDALVRDLGRYAPGNHAVRIDGGDALYLLRDMPAIPRPRKSLCRVDAGQQVTECWPWDTGDRPWKLNVAALLPGGLLARAYALDPRPAGLGRLEVRDLDTGSLRYAHPLGAAPTCLAASDHALYYALGDGTLGAIDLATGARLCERRLHIAELPAIAPGLAARGPDLACGTLDGRVLLLRLERGG